MDEEGGREIESIDVSDIAVKRRRKINELKKEGK